MAGNSWLAKCYLINQSGGIWATKCYLIGLAGSTLLPQSKLTR